MRSGRLRLILQGGLAPDPRTPGVPFMLDLATNDEQRQALRFLYSSEAFGRPYAAPPGVRPERVAALRKAFRIHFADGEFVADAARQGFDMRPISGVDMTALIEEMARTPKPVIDRVAALMRPPGAKWLLRLHAAHDRLADAERLGVEQHEGGARCLFAAIDPGMVGGALDQDVSGLEPHGKSSMSMSSSPQITTT